MGKNRNKKKNGSEPMATDSFLSFSEVMDASEAVAPKPTASESFRKVKKGRPMKRSKNARKMQAVAKAMSQIEKTEVKILKGESKTARTDFAKRLYD
ncbi:uncharacterized protein LOC142517789 [Primulina tabacum]|uniref:uncharacterized protein LOC142517789 n=1 Tax=Primulina tabacum TaxID=48773 RepID=UPI003F596C11